MLRATALAVAAAVLATMLPLATPSAPAVAAPLAPALATATAGDEPEAPTEQAPDPGDIPLDVESGLARVSGVGLDWSRFDPGYLIADHQFFDGDAMSEAEIQAFLNSRGPSDCGVFGSWCLDNVPIPSTAYAGSNNCTPYAAASGGSETVASVIWKVQTACNVSAKVILVTLEKEQGLITGTWSKTDSGATAAFQRRLQRAMGYGCPDTAPCDQGAADFIKQVLFAAWQFQQYRREGGRTYLPGRVNYIQYNPNPGCGGSNVLIRNQATAGLYTYTPYQPDAAAIAAYPRVSNDCGAYGNRNFWAFYTSWFGDPRTYTIPATANRVDGATRYDVAKNIALSAYPSGASTVYVANGENFPDGLVSAPAAALVDAPLLMTTPTMLPLPTAQAIQLLRPTSIVVVGGTASVSDEVYAQLEALLPVGGSIRRDSGVDRFEAAREIARSAFTSAPTVYLANGLNFPDALSTSAAAGAAGAPILLVQPWDVTLDDATLELLDELGTTNIVIAGGPASVSTQLQSWLTSSGTVATVMRQQGVDRYEAGRAVNEAAFPTATRAFVASGQTFPDAMAAAAVAAATGRPLLLSVGSCTPIGVLQYLERAGVTRVDFLGGVNTITPRALSYEVCS
jgi:putative cell wall-binding protein